MKIYTNRYRDFTPAQGIPVRITMAAAVSRIIEIARRDAEED